MSKPSRESPAVLAPGWPDVPVAIPEVEKARRLTLNLRAAIGGRSIRSVARGADLDEATLRRVLAGTVWPDLLTIARLEQTLAVDLYPHSDTSGV